MFLAGYNVMIPVNRVSFPYQRTLRDTQLSFHLGISFDPLFQLAKILSPKVFPTLPSFIHFTDLISKLFYILAKS